MHQLLQWMTHSATHLVEMMGLWGILVGMILESACIPIPSEAIMLSGGVLVSKGSEPFIGVLAAGVAGNVIGSMIAYYVGALGGKRLLEKYGKYIFFKPHHLKQSEKWFERYGESTVFFTRNLPFIRTFISLPAGIAGMNVGRFLLFTVLGCLPWNIALAFLGYHLGNNWQVVEKYLRPVSYSVAALVVGGLIFWFFRKQKKSSDPK